MSFFRVNWSIIISSIISLSLLSGCLPAAFIAGATLGGAVVYDKRDTSAMLDDNGIGKQVKYKIDKDFEFKQFHSRVKIAVFNQVVLLVGEVPNDQLRQRAYALAMSVKNVKRVYNQLEVSGEISLMQQSNDAWITSKVRSMMLAAKGLHSTQIKVITENKVVYLMGIVTRKQAELASDAARHVTGVSKVVEVFEYEE